MSATEIAKLTRIGRFNMDGKQEASGAMALLKRLKPKAKEGGAAKTTAGAEQMKMLRRLPKLLRFIPGTAQDVRAYFLTLQYWLAGSEDNIVNMVRFLVDRYADGPRRSLRGTLKSELPAEYPEVGSYHPRMKGRIAETAEALPKIGKKGTVGVLLLRSYPLAGNAAHYDGVINALEARGLNVVPAFASARFTPCIATASGSHIAAMSYGIPSGIGRIESPSRASRTSNSSVNAPSGPPLPI